MAIDLKQIAAMSREEKLQMMEALWADLSRDETIVESPAWHEEELRKTPERVAAGQEEVLEWDQAKRELRERFD